jgi:hypothetical protein
VRRAQQGREREEDTQTQDRGHGSDRGDRRVRLRRSYDLGQRSSLHAWLQTVYPGPFVGRGLLRRQRDWPQVHEAARRLPRLGQRPLRTRCRQRQPGLRIAIVASTRGLLYTLARLMGDVNAVKKGTVGKRIARRTVGKATGRWLGWLFR